jgi:predicted aldo/keto reductase-like oxidoreductase
MNRREFLQATVALTVAPTLSRTAGPGEVPGRKLGRTGATISMVGVGGAHLGLQATEQESIAIIRKAIDGGITFLDNCWDYNGGQSELRMGKALRDGYRARSFLMTKIDGRDAKTAQQQIDESLQRLQTDHLDLLQLHEVIRADDPARAFAKGGAIEAMIAAQKAGKARFLGFTGHKSPAIHLSMLDAAQAHGFRFDAVQLPLNVMDAHVEGFEKRVLPRLVNEEIGVLGMKSMGDSFILKSGAAQPEECLRYSMSLPTSVVITGMDAVDRVDQALRITRGFKPFTEAEIAKLLRRTAAAAKDLQWEKYKSSDHFDGTAHHPEWLG